MRSSKLIIKDNAQNQMAKFGSGCNFHDLNYFELDFFSSYSLNSLYTQGHYQIFFCRNSPIQTKFIIF